MYYYNIMWIMLQFNGGFNYEEFFQRSLIAIVADSFSYVYANVLRYKIK